MRIVNCEGGGVDRQRWVGMGKVTNDTSSLV